MYSLTEITNYELAELSDVIMKNRFNKKRLKATLSELQVRVDQIQRENAQLKNANMSLFMKLKTQG